MCFALKVQGNRSSAEIYVCIHNTIHLFCYLISFFSYSIQIQLKFLLPQAKFVFISQKHLEKWRKMFILLFQVVRRIFLLF